MLSVLSVARSTASSGKACSDGSQSSYDSWRTSAAAVANHNGIVISAQIARFQVRTFCPSSMKKGIILNAPSQRLMNIAHGRKLNPLMTNALIPPAESPT